ncbi:uncharacterized protein LOC17896106 [Capsella rubella]|nr:uncharacterized protein LOC17896106 [Capsella rubella]
MIVYPQGNEEDNGKGFVSMYVELDKSCFSSTTTPPKEVFAYLSFFVFNMKENKYFSVQDVEVKRFDSSKTVWGVSQMLPLEKFNDTEDGFNWHGECKFGAHVVVVPSPVSFGETLPFHKFSWKVRDFSVLKQNDYVSKTFAMGEKKWTLKLYPKGDSHSREGDDLTMNLLLADGEILPRGELICVQIHLKVLDPRGSNHLTGWRRGWILPSTKDYGFPLYICLAKLQEALDREDALDVEIECEVLNAFKNHPLF